MGLNRVPALGVGERRELDAVRGVHNATGAHLEDVAVAHHVPLGPAVDQSFVGPGRGEDAAEFGQDLVALGEEVIVGEDRVELSFHHFQVFASASASWIGGSENGRK